MGQIFSIKVRFSFDYMIFDNIIFDNIDYISIHIALSVFAVLVLFQSFHTLADWQQTVRVGKIISIFISL